MRCSTGRMGYLLFWKWKKTLILALIYVLEPTGQWKISLPGRLPSWFETFTEEKLLKFSLLRLKSIKPDHFQSITCILIIFINGSLRICSNWHLKIWHSKEPPKNYLANKFLGEKLELSSLWDNNFQTLNFINTSHIWVFVRNSFFNFSRGISCRKTKFYVSFFWDTR